MRCSRSALALLVVLFVTRGVLCQGGDPLRAGIIGTTTSHVKAFTQLMNDPKATGPLADVRVVAGVMGGMPDNPASWDRREGYAEFLRQKGCTIYDTVEQMLEHIDVVLLESVDGRPHLAQAKPVIAAGKPLFIDKPMAASLVDVLAIFRLAREAGVPCFSSSSLRFGKGFQAARSGSSSFGRITSCTAWSPMKTEPHHPDLYWYGIHGVETLFTIMGSGCLSVTRVAENRVEGVWPDGRKGTFVGKKGYGAEVVGSTAAGNAGKYEGYKALVIEICRFFTTGKPPVSAEETIAIYTFMSAADESKRLGGKTVSMEEVLAKARSGLK